MPTSPLVRFGTSTWTYEGWKGQVYKREYAKSTFTRECLGENFHRVLGQFSTEPPLDKD